MTDTLPANIDTLHAPRGKDAELIDTQRILASELDDLEILAALTPAAKLAVVAHAGKEGLDGRPLVLHCAEVAVSPHLASLEQRQLGLLHDAATPSYTNLSPEEFIARARDAGCSERVAAAAVCFARPTEGWEYDDWISFLMRDELTRTVKIVDSEHAILNFPPASANQLASWQRTQVRLAQNDPESPDVTARIEASMQVHPLPDLRNIRD